ncbi:hypothetical protein [Streptosporangium sp. CA-115845]|uniref:hypothetical protein n=1 Tax=Streptosporangium sp. CA-115845 TaxID=3240071 RepID=UPI003D94FD13
MAITIQQTRRFHRVRYLGEEWTLPVDGLGNSRLASLLRAARGWGLPITISPVARTETVRACTWCRARARALAWAGPRRYELNTCDAAQCVAGRRAVHEHELDPPAHVIARLDRLRDAAPATCRTSRSQRFSDPFAPQPPPSHPAPLPRRSQP